MKNVFIFGSTGYIGMNLCKYLSFNSLIKVYTVGRKGCDVKVDLESDYLNLLNYAREGDFVVFLASISSPDICNKKPDLAYEVNVNATLNLINKLTSHGVKVIFSSTDLVFGKNQTIAEDDSQLQPFGFYGEMKANVEKNVYHNNLVKIVRFSYVMGKGDKYTEMLLKACKDKVEVEVFDGFDRNVVALSDVLEGIGLLIYKWDINEAQSINFVGPNLVSRWEMTKIFAHYQCPNLICKVIKAPDSFWEARPKKIEMVSSYFSGLLERKPKNIVENLEGWNNL